VDTDVSGIWKEATASIGLEQHHRTQQALLPQPLETRPPIDTNLSGIRSIVE
jgi:hypothetical protein